MWRFEEDTRAVLSAVATTASDAKGVVENQLLIPKTSQSESCWGYAAKQGNEWPMGPTQHRIPILRMTNVKAVRLQNDFMC